MQNNTLTHSSSYKRKFSVLSPDAAKQLVDKNNHNLKIIASLTEELENEVKKRSDIEKELEQWKKRLVDREVELRGIITKISQDREESYTNDHQTNRIPPFISTLHHSIAHKIEENNTETSKWLQNKQKLNLQYMERKLEALKKQMEQKVGQQKSLTMENLKTILQEIEDVRSMALCIDNENQKLMNEVRELRIRNKILVEERKIAINENVVNNMKMKEMKEMSKRAESIESKRPSTESRRFKSERNSIHNSLIMSQEINPNQSYNRFLGEPVFDSPKQKRVRQFKTSQTPEIPKVNEREQKSILALQRSLKREKKRNHEMYTLFAENSQKNNQINEIIWESMDQAKKESQGNGTTFHTCVLSNLVKTQEVIKRIEKLRETDRVPIRLKKSTIDLSDLPQLD